ncbi:hypothetical protein KA093_03820 [Candidatus Saccharibacteria bacterium]|nr:hypothetical protein [Candidatus Saccharibacteria bacterium]
MNNKTNTTGAQANQDFKNAILIVSLLVNAFVLTTWMVASLSASYAAQLAQLV